MNDTPGGSPSLSFIAKTTFSRPDENPFPLAYHFWPIFRCAASQRSPFFVCVCIEFSGIFARAFPSQVEYMGWGFRQQSIGSEMIASYLPLFCHFAASGLASSQQKSRCILVFPFPPPPNLPTLHLSPRPHQNPPFPCHVIILESEKDRLARSIPP